MKNGINRPRSIRVRTVCNQRMHRNSQIMVLCCVDIDLSIGRVQDIPDLWKCSRERELTSRPTWIQLNQCFTTGRTYFVICFLYVQKGLILRRELSNKKGSISSLIIIFYGYNHKLSLYLLNKCYLKFIELNLDLVVC